MKKLALITGINYRGSKYELGGCINDASMILNTLVKKFDFNQSNIQLLIEEVATKKNILKGLEWLVNQLEPGDIGLFTYSGHGTQTADLPPIDEEDMLDEAIVPIDALADQSNLIRDDEINTILSNIPKGVKFVVILDSCHSGTGTRNFGNYYSIPQARTIEDVKAIINSFNNVERRDLSSIKPRYIPPTQTIQDIKMIMSGFEPIRKDFSSFSGPNHILLAGCKADQVSYDEGTYGRFTKALTDVMGSQSAITYKELYFLVRNMVLERSNYAQEPQLEGPDDLINLQIFE
ncbi:TPA: caspase family protein [Bacillus cereus]|uniref:caspase family protein n=1 Tax=Bacillus TaxID=1386 RepID=UPI000352E225|nr:MULTISPECIES: caspase family protein [Bacillus]EPF08342.1 hypothetical protein ICA_05739 [Bacillus cereus BAG1O-3]PFG72722.1 Caspase domain-containing protein [Bacillus sp. YF23]HDR4868747.1 caspase family protein [Bacillus cereus]HDR4880265.1 caspase family protein [Bacillus cereus]